MCKRVQVNRASVADVRLDTSRVGHGPGGTSVLVEFLLLWRGAAGTACDWRSVCGNVHRHMPTLSKCFAPPPALCPHVPPSWSLVPLHPQSWPGTRTQIYAVYGSCCIRPRFRRYWQSYCRPVAAVNPYGRVYRSCIRNSDEAFESSARVHARADTYITPHTVSSVPNELL